MPKSLAITGSQAIFGINGLKRSALLFDQVALVPGIDDSKIFLLLYIQHEMQHRKRQVTRANIDQIVREVLASRVQVSADLEWLFENEILTPLDPDLSFMEGKSHAILTEDIPNFDNLSDSVQKRFIMLRAAEIVEYEGARTASARLRNLGVDAVPIITPPRWVAGEQSSRENVLQVVIKNLPEPDESTPWQDILDFRNDAGTKRTLVAIRNWINEVGRSSLPPIEVEQKIEYLLQEYEEHMRLHRIKIQRGAIETILMASAEILENAIRLRFGKMAQTCFSLMHRKYDLLEAERKAPGRELAFVLHARAHFD